ncbi:substrate-binding domain-containing protein [Microvirga thermotolerans]|uniref:Quinoprotein dehydrogenase-associated putative ABC transporter substrate-binding protein n=1 Tax=Microvirga thermotolerans TaxID=2651334 RepID=A0A5P9JZ20_9HYPH|nr:substrate-binding domain-containing protein [Microvirga thermotolerans]QFU17499.1 quinoprotein dehydrogenase-associated putative ABC transporter substrate-binding protein [Microvirga thermotolerans]
MCSSSRKALFALALLVCPAAEAGELRVCADPNNLPFTNEKGEGFENRIAGLVAQDLGADVSYLWYAQRRGFLRETLKAKRCDIVMGLPSNLEGVRTTAPYYRSSYVFIVRAGDPLPKTFDDPILRERRVGVQLVGDDGWNTPPAHALARRGIIDNVRGYTLYGDYSEPDPPSRIVRAVAEGEIDIAVAWGPMAGYFAPREKVRLELAPVRPAFDGPQLPMVWDISAAVRKEDDALRQRIDDILERRRPEIDAILAEFGVPRLDTSVHRTAGAP